MVPWNAARTKVQIKLSIQRLRTLQEKKLALAKKSRREIADLLGKGRLETARLRVEGLIQDDIYVELLELLELYSEKLQARFNLLDASTTEPEASIEDAVCAIVYAAPRTELKELQVLREILMHKYGRPFALSLQVSDPPPASVPPRIISKLAIYTPPRELVDAYLGEIAKGYGIEWAGSAPAPPLPASLPPRQDDDDDDDGPGEGQEKEKASAAPLAVPDGELDLDKSPKSKSNSASIPDSAAGGSGGGGGGGGGAGLPSVPTYPAGAEKDAWADSAGGAAGKKMTPDEELAKRFERLKNLK